LVKDVFVKDFSISESFKVARSIAGTHKKYLKQQDKHHSKKNPLIHPISDNNFPISILKTGLSSLETIVKYLRETKKLSYIEIGILLKRNPRTLAVSYNLVKNKYPEKFSKYITASKIRIPFKIFQVKLSVLESICIYLKSLNYSYSEIAKLIEKDQRTVWTVCKRAEKKLGKNNG
jgi:hypothetical protein